ncbi:hypothetical protein BDQ12DRAFT_678417 [Crucibulum laeve]|uniref:Uncharacterized protein n=1 Tax=Crucibulum laeve TaxID=68775 RepID=A0A5C3MA21_9AGAR|nr:hypothetical protein BDQ12DRAFT_678417 [Crucibulum laeve]
MSWRRADMNFCNAICRGVFEREWEEIRACHACRQLMDSYGKHEASKRRRTLCPSPIVALSAAGFPSIFLCRSLEMPTDLISMSMV